MGDPARACMLSLLMDGPRPHRFRARAHGRRHGPDPRADTLSRMAEANLLAARAQGRNRFLPAGLVGRGAHAIESLMALAGTRAAPAIAKRRLAAATRTLPLLRRTCYDHLACQVGIAVTDSLTRAGHIEPKGRATGRSPMRATCSVRGSGSTCRARRRAGSRPLCAPMPRLERTTAAHLGRAGGGHCRHLLPPRLGRAAAPQPYRAADRFRTPGDGQPFWCDRALDVSSTPAC